MPGWQDIAVLVTVLAAACYVVLRMRRSATGKGASACSGCGDCPNFGHPAEQGGTKMGRSPSGIPCGNDQPIQGVIVSLEPARYDGPLGTQRNPGSTDDHGHSAAS
ncbi:MAG: hypothetical protein ABR915_23040 [Thermoguttaceae bacterium]